MTLEKIIRQPRALPKEPGGPDLTEVQHRLAEVEQHGLDLVLRLAYGVLRHMNIVSRLSSCVSRPGHRASFDEHPPPHASRSRGRHVITKRLPHPLVHLLIGYH